MSTPPDAMLQAAFDAINKLRARYGAQAVKWDANLYSGCYYHAQKLANEDGGLKHASPDGFAENLDIIYGKWNGKETPYEKVGVEAVRRWWASRPEFKGHYPDPMVKGEEWMYFYDGTKVSDDWGHFANLVGKNHHSMGMSALQTANPIKSNPTTGRGWYVVLRMTGDFTLSQGKQYTQMPLEKAYMMDVGQAYPTNGSENNAGEGVMTGPAVLDHGGCDHFIDCEPGSTLTATHYTGGTGYQLTKVTPVKLSIGTFNATSTTVMSEGWSTFAEVNHCHCEDEGHGCEIPRKQLKLPSPSGGTMVTYTPVGDDGYQSEWRYETEIVSIPVRTTVSVGWAALIKKYQLCCLK